MKRLPPVQRANADCRNSVSGDLAEIEGHPAPPPRPHSNSSQYWNRLNSAYFNINPIEPNLRSAKIQMRIHAIFTAVFILFILSASGEEILPKDWLTPDQLQRAERPIQDQLDTGKAMGATAWDMAALKDARLLLIYVAIYERLPDRASRAAFYSEQQAWLKQRQRTVRALADPNGGSMVLLDQASMHMDLTDKRLAVLQKHLDQMKK